MAFTTVLMTALLVTFASGYNYRRLFLAGFPAWNEDFPFPGFPAPMVSLRFAAPQTMAGVPKFPFPFFGGFPFPTMPPMGFPAIPSVGDISSTIPASGGTYNGVMVSTQTESKRNEDGTVVKSGGSTVMINDNGKVTVEKTGDAPPEIVPAAKLFKKIKPVKFMDFFGQSSEEIETVTTGDLEDYVPSKGEKFTGHSVISSSFSSNVNGEKKEGAIVSKVNNDNGLVSTHNFVFQADGTQE
ncbi:unnamed protein product [Chrysodeixis includens]|uniref:Uncharacterized protein n=1 Tax=Chrysodeixis includens TaxID=689277 RepID=A0A9P0BWF7_CHRIL|nr:unnamed protein product [Chrysodeixis includens]